MSKQNRDKTFSTRRFQFEHSLYSLSRARAFPPARVLSLSLSLSSARAHVTRLNVGLVPRQWPLRGRRGRRRSHPFPLGAASGAGGDGADGASRLADPEADVPRRAGGQIERQGAYGAYRSVTRLGETEKETEKKDAHVPMPSSTFQ